MRIETTKLGFEREPLGAPWGFKGGYLTELWQTVVGLGGDSDQRSIGLGTQSVLWCDPRVFARFSEPAGNAAMLLLTERALQIARGVDFDTPLDLMDAILPETLAYGRKVTGISNLRDVFALNALVALDNAAWMLWASERGVASFDDLIPTFARPALNARHSSVISAPAIGYGLSIPEIVRLVTDGFFVLKVKLGSDPDRDGDPQKMLEWDAARMESIHSAVASVETPGSPTGRPLYYLDANGRYDHKERVWRLLDRLDRCGALSRTILLEEPFPEDVMESVEDLPVRVVLDESASSEQETRQRIELGYGAVALKPIAKTLSVTFRIARVCHDLGVPAFCADLTVNPILVDWNKNVAARLPSLPGLDGGLQETNGWQNYRDWDRMQAYHTRHDQTWTSPVAGRFRLDEEFYTVSGGVLEMSEHYSRIV